MFFFRSARTADEGYVDRTSTWYILETANYRCNESANLSDVSRIGGNLLACKITTLVYHPP